MCALERCNSTRRGVWKRTGLARAIFTAKVATAVLVRRAGQVQECAVCTALGYLHVHTCCLCSASCNLYVPLRRRHGPAAHLVRAGRILLIVSPLQARTGTADAVCIARQALAALLIRAETLVAGGGAACSSSAEGCTRRRRLRDQSSQTSSLARTLGTDHVMRRLCDEARGKYVLPAVSPHVRCKARAHCNT